MSKNVAQVNISDSKNGSSNFDMQDSILKNVRMYWPLYIMVIPGIIWLIVFRFIPLMGTIIAFKDYSVFKGFMDSSWVGLKHFKTLFNYSGFYTILSNTLILGFIKLVFQFPIPIILALMMNEVKNNTLKKTVQTSVYIPHFLSWVIVGGLTFDFLGMGGIFNIIREALGLESILVMQKEAYFRPVYVLTAIWKEAGWGTVVYLAAISAIEPSLYEAAKIDGANRLKQMFYVTLPLMIPTILTLLILNIGHFMELGFEHTYSLLTPMTYSVGDIFDTYVYRTGILEARYSFTTAVGIFQSTVGFILIFTFNKLSKKFSEGGVL